LLSIVIIIVMFLLFLRRNNILIDIGLDRYFRCIFRCSEWVNRLSWRL